ncbi:MAG: hypothetical protein ACREFD_15590, partial [Stellaceae bacterium]
LTAKRSGLARKETHPGGLSMAKKEVNLLAKVGGWAVHLGNVGLDSVRPFVARNAEPPTRIVTGRSPDCGSAASKLMDEPAILIGGVVKLDLSSRSRILEGGPRWAKVTDFGWRSAERRGDNHVNAGDTTK